MWYLFLSAYIFGVVMGFVCAISVFMRPSKETEKEARELRQSVRSLEGEGDEIQTQLNEHRSYIVKSQADSDMTINTLREMIEERDGYLAEYRKQIARVEESRDKWERDFHDQYHQHANEMDEAVNLIHSIGNQIKDYFKTPEPSTATTYDPNEPPF